MAWLISLAAVVGIALCLFSWFRDVRQIMKERKHTVESAAGQLDVYREKARKTKGDPETAALFARSESIYRQAVDIYNQTLKRPLNYLPARLMGFQYIG